MKSFQQPIETIIQLMQSGEFAVRYGGLVDVKAPSANVPLQSPLFAFAQQLSSMRVKREKAADNLPLSHTDTLRASNRA